MSTPTYPQDFSPGSTLVAFGVLCLVVFTIALPFFVAGIHSRLKRLEKLHRRIADDVLAELRRINGPRQGPGPSGRPQG